MTKSATSGDVTHLKSISGNLLLGASNTPTRILIIDDDVKLCRLVRDYLQPLGYEVIAAHTAQDGLESALREAFAAVVLDVMLPGMSGFDLLRQLRASSEVPVLMLTGRGEEPDRIMGLELGADDYLPKTFSTRELLARLRAVIRRSIVTARKSTERAQTVTIGNLRIEAASRAAWLNDEPLQLTTVEFDLLASLAKSAGRVKSREQLLLEAADRNFDVFDRSIDVHISSIRRKLRDDPKSPRFIITVRSVGYMMRKAAPETLS